MHGERLRCSSLCFCQEALSCLVSLFLSLPRFIKTTFYGSIHLEQSYEYILVYPSLRTESIASSCTFDFDRDFSPEAHDIKGHPCEPHETSINSVSIAPNLVSPSLPSRQKPLQLPPILHDFPVKHYKYLPKFDGESKDFTAEKHLQSFEHLLNLFEIEHDDDYMRYFSQSLQGDAKEWFKHSQSINTWEEFSCTFLKFQGRRRPLDQILSEFYSLKRHEGEAISNRG